MFRGRFTYIDSEVTNWNIRNIRCGTPLSIIRSNCKIIGECIINEYSFNDGILSVDLRITDIDPCEKYFKKLSGPVNLKDKTISGLGEFNAFLVDYYMVRYLWGRL